MGGIAVAHHHDTTAGGIARQLIELHEQATRNGYPGEDKYPGLRFDALANTMYLLARSELTCPGRRHRSRALQYARELVALSRPARAVTYEVEILVNNRHDPQCGRWTAPPLGAFGGPPRDRAEACQRALTLRAEGYTARALKITTAQEIVLETAWPWDER